MRIEILIFAIAAFLIANIYTDGKYMKLVYSWKKYYQMAGIAFGAFMIYILLKRNPMRAKDIVMASNEYIKYLPIDRNTSNMISPILDFTSRSYGDSSEYSSLDGGNPIINMSPAAIEQSSRQDMIINSGKGTTKRSVSESKKKFVASRQGWKCSACGEVLTASFEVDHIKRLEYGGDNHIDNLRAMCRNCHGHKTTMENL